MKEPKIRFKGFEGEWTSPTINNVFELRNGYTPSKAVNEFWEGGTIPWFRMEDIRTNGGILKDAIQHITPLGVKGAGLFEKNSIILATTATIGEHAMLIADSLANQQFTNFKVRKSLSDKYIADFIYYSFFGIDEWSKKNTNSGGLLSVNIPLLLKQPFYTPDTEEQKQIASYLTNLDALISSSASRLSCLKQVKEASLQAMFPQEGETVPKIRFKGFEGEWKKVRLGDIAIFSKGNGYSKNDLQEVGIPLILYGRLYTKYQSFITDIDTYTTLLKYGSVLSKGNEIILPASGETPEDIARASAVLKANVILGGDLNIMQFDMGKYSTSFIALAITYSKTHYDLSKVAQGKSVVHLQNGEIAKAEIMLPPFAEQRAIASYFTALDRRITLQSQRLEKLKQIKAACLDKMFV